jgi:hypothetical protein
MRDHRTLDPPPRINIKIAGGAVESRVSDFEKIWHGTDAP